jgi:uncharacterized LabA/DUF88 family protein
MVSNLAIFVDAGYLYKQGALAAYGSALKRHEVSLDAKEFVDRLTTYVIGQFPNDELFRTYWYDGSKGGVASNEQLSVAALAYVKFRRGRINSAGQQKGVDTLIVRDLMVLSQERSIQRAIVLSGDEDLREGIEYAQDRGVRVAVLGIEASGWSSQSTELRREADQVLALPPEILQASLVRVVVAAPDIASAGSSSGVAATAVTPAGGSPGAHDIVLDAAREYAQVWASASTANDIAALMSQQPGLPKELDRELLKFVVRRTHIYPLSQDQCKGARSVFRVAVDVLGAASIKRVE